MPASASLKVITENLMGAGKGIIASLSLIYKKSSLSLVQSSHLNSGFQNSNFFLSESARYFCLSPLLYDTFQIWYSLDFYGLNY